MGAAHTHRRPQNKRDVVNHNKSVNVGWLGFSRQTSRYFRASDDTEPTDPDVFHRSVRLDQPTATPVHSQTPEGSPHAATAVIGLSRASGFYVWKASEVDF